MMIVRKKIQLGIIPPKTGSDSRQIDHLILCVHGIGQKLGERMEGVNFVHRYKCSSTNIKGYICFFYGFEYFVE